MGDLSPRPPGFLSVGGERDQRHHPKGCGHTADCFQQHGVERGAVRLLALSHGVSDQTQTAGDNQSKGPDVDGCERQ